MITSAVLFFSSGSCDLLLLFSEIRLLLRYLEEGLERLLLESSGLSGPQESALVPRDSL